MEKENYICGNCGKMRTSNPYQDDYECFKKQNDFFENYYKDLKEKKWKKEK